MYGRCALLALLGGFPVVAGIGSEAAAQRIAFRPLPPDTRVTWSPREALPRIPFAELPLDDRISPRDMGGDLEGDDPWQPVPTAAEQARLDARVAALFPRQDYAPRPAIWRIGDRDTTIYMFGTIHVLPPGFRWRSPTVERIARAASTLLVESVEDPAAPDPFADGPVLRRLMDRVSPSHRAKLAAFTATLPPEAAATLDTLPTWVAAVAISVAREIRAGEVPGPGADAWFESEFRRRGRPVLAIEDGAKVAADANAIPEAEARAMLDAALDAPAFDRARAHAPLHAWAQGRLGPDAVALNSRTLSEALLDRRNAAWANTLRAKLAVPGTMLFVAGAGHFTGSRSVIAWLEAAGIRVTRVE